MWFVHRYRVYLWLEMASQEAEVVHEVSASHGGAAIQKAMKACGVPYAHYAWAVPSDEQRPCVDEFAVRCLAVPFSACQAG